jgi:hypothetical protein
MRLPEVLEETYLRRWRLGLVVVESAATIGPGIRLRIRYLRGRINENYTLQDGQRLHDHDLGLDHYLRLRFFEHQRYLLGPVWSMGAGSEGGGQATLTFYGDSRSCTYTVTCKGERDKLNFAVHQDGSLSGQGFMPVLRKSK